MLKVGDKAPEFSLPNDAGVDTSLADLLRDGPLILYFYPADFTPGCTREACSIRDIHEDIVAVGLQVVGVSPQSPDSHARFREEHRLPFLLLSDEDKAVIRLYDVDGPFGVGVRRATYLVNQERTIQGALKADVLIGKHSEFINEAIKLKRSVP